LHAAYLYRQPEVQIRSIVLSPGKFPPTGDLEAKLRADPKWDIRKELPPLDPKKAFQIAEAWLGNGGDLLDIRIVSLSRGYSNALAGHFFYVLEFALPPLDRMDVVILMCGEVVEPATVKPKDEKR
jgi:hypothetical protein